MNKYDVVVIGAGLGGLTVACQLAQANKKVLLVSSGAGTLLLASGCVDVLGFQPMDSREPIKNPLDKMATFLTENPNHPYTFTGQENMETGLNAFLQLVNRSSLNYQGSVHRNWLLPSGIGAIHPTCLAPLSLANGDLSKGGTMLLVGFKELRDFYPMLVSQNLNEQKLGVQADAVTIDAPAPIGGNMNVTPIELARAFEKADFRREVVKAIKNSKVIKSSGKGYDRFGFPSVLGLNRHAEVLADLEKQLGKTVFEISTLPPSVPGRRLFEGLRQTFLQLAKGRFLMGTKVVDGTIEKGRVTQIRIDTASELKTIKADHYVLATGGIFGGGLQTDLTGKIWEPIFGLPVVSNSDRHTWFADGFLEPQGQPVNQYGVKINAQMNPVDESNQPLSENLYLVGAIIANSDWTRGRAGEGVGLATAAAVIKQISG